MKDEVLVVIVTRNNSALLEFELESMRKHDAGYPHEILILDAESTDKKHLKLLDKLSKKYRVETVPNGRVETNYNRAWEQNKDYSYYFFNHDDTCMTKDNWLKMFVDRMDSGYYEKIIGNTHFKDFPIGKVGVGTQFWRSYDSVMGQPVQCLFLREVLDLIRPGKTPQIFKYSDNDRVLVKNQCLVDTNGHRNIEDFVKMKEENSKLFYEIVTILEKFLPYYDEGAYPIDKYPPGETWNKFCLVSEYLGSIDPLIEGWRTVGLSNDGYLEQIMGFDIPYSHHVVYHFGSPEMREFLGRHFDTDKEEVKKHFCEKPFLIKCDRLIREYLNSNVQ